MKQYILLSIFFLFHTLATGQVKMQPDSIRLVGVVMDPVSLHPVVNVSVVSSSGFSSSDELGNFALMVAPGDTVQFRHTGYRPYAYAVSDTLYKREYALGVFLSADTILLPEVVVFERYIPKKQLLHNARQNMQGVGYSAFAPRAMDATMNQRMNVEEFATSIEMKGHVKVGFGVGTHSISELEKLRLQKRFKGHRETLNDLEIDMLKKLYNKEK